MSALILCPHDTLFLRDGRPFNQGDQEQAATSGIFPPYPPTVVGAMRAALGRARGWAGGAWSAKLKATLGDGVDWAAGDGALGPLRFVGPIVMKGAAPRFPVPLCLLVKRSGDTAAAVARLAPGPELDCDLGRVSLPQPVTDIEGAKAPEDDWIDADGLKAVLDGGAPAPASLVAQDELWQTEARAGIARDAATRTMGDDALYAAAHVRLKDGIAFAVSVDGADLAGLAGSMIPLGGEGRSVWIERCDAGLALPEPPALAAGDDGMLRYTIVLLTPAYFGDDEGDWPQPEGRICDGEGTPLPGRIVSACVGKPVRIGGWDSVNRTPLPLRPLAPAGSVWFMEAAADDAGAVLQRHGRGIGRSTAWGFGLALVGCW